MSTPPTTTALVQRPMAPQAVIPRTIEELMALADIFFKGGMCPKGCGRPEAVAAVIAFGLEVGMKPAAAVSSIHLTGGRGTIWGDMPMALVRASGLLEEIDESFEGDGDSRTAVCKVRRKGDQKVYVKRYSVAEARKAGLMMKGGKPGPWDTDTDQMLHFRARGRLFRDVFADVLNGLTVNETADDADQPATPVTPTTDIQVTTVFTDGVAKSTMTTTVDGVLMIDDGQLYKIRQKVPHWYTTKQIDTSDPEAAAVKWREFLTKAFGVDSATKLSHEQAAELLDHLIEIDPDPTMAAMFPSHDTPPAVTVQPATAAA